MKRLFFYFFLILVSNFSFSEVKNGIFENIDTTLKLKELQEKDNANLENELSQLIKLSKENSRKEISQDEIGSMRLKLEQIQLNLNNYNNKVTALNRLIEDENKRLENLQILLQKQNNPLFINSDKSANLVALENTKKALDNTTKYLNIVRQYKTEIIKSTDLLLQQRNLLEDLYQRDNERYLNAHQKNNLQDEDLQIINQISLLEKERSNLLNIKIDSRENRNLFLDKNIELALISKQILFTNIMLELTSIERHLQELQFADFSSVSLEYIQRVRTELNEIELRISENQKQLKDNFLINNEQFGLYVRQRKNTPQNIISRQENLANLYAEISTLIDNIGLNLEIINKNTTSQHTLLSKSHLTKRYFIVDYVNLYDVRNIISQSVTTILGQYTVALNTVKDSLLGLTQRSWGIILLVAITAGIITISLIEKINQIVAPINNETRLPFAKRLILFLYSMYKYNLPYLVLLLLVYLLVYFTKLPSPSSNLIVLVPALLLATAVPYYATKILVSSKLIKTPEHMNLVFLVTTIAAIGNTLFALVLLSQWVLIDNREVIINLYRWLFSIYVLLASYPVLMLLIKTWRYMDEYYRDYLIYRILKILITLLPIASALFALFSLLGYINLSWLFAKHFMIFIFYSLIWAAYLAICKDLSLWAKRYALKNTSKGLFWAQDVINPLHSILRAGGLYFAIKALFDNFNWDSKTPIIADVLSLLKTPIFGDEGGQFTVLNIILMSALIYVIFKIGGWVKSFAYRWIFAKIVDLGIRNSISVFSQYAIVTLGFLLALRIIGLDLTAFTVFAGALGVGIGFGMQTIANNFISGILLLIERPLRNGDIITVGKYEGRVERIGMRSLTITTFNNESVILPNSDFVTAAFMNWSHTDQIVRTILYLDISYRHSPEDVKSAFTDALNRLVKSNHILGAGEFEFGIFAYDCSERGVRYRVQYFMNMDIHRLNDIRHVVVSALWQACYENNFEIAYQKHDIYFPEFTQFKQLINKTTEQALLNKEIDLNRGEA